MSLALFRAFGPYFQVVLVEKAILWYRKPVFAIRETFPTTNSKICQTQDSIEDLNGVVFKNEPINFYRIVQEVLNNILKHAKATKVEINMELAQDQLMVTIKDNGRGFSLPKHQNRNVVQDLIRGLGLSIMEERTRSLDGDFQVYSQIGKGTTIALAVPVTLKKQER